MRIELPPVLFYGIGVLLIVFGVLRAYHLGWQRRTLDRPADQSEDGEVGPRANPTARRHITFGVLWVAMGLFLVISTYINSHR
jgi:hypothetical protein